MTQSLAVPTNEPERLAAEATTWPGRARELEVADDESYEFAASMVLAIKDLRAEIERTFKPMRDATHAAHKKVCDQQKMIEAPLLEADALVAPKLRVYLQRKEQERLIAERQAREAQRRAEEEARAAEAANLAAAGETEAAAEVLATPLPPSPPVVVPPSVPKTGISTRAAWKGRVTDLRALCRAIGAGTVPVAAVEVKQATIDAQARMVKSEMNWPGVEAYEETGIVRRG